MMESSTSNLEHVILKDYYHYVTTMINKLTFLTIPPNQHNDEPTFYVAVELQRASCYVTDLLFFFCSTNN